MLWWLQFFLEVIQHLANQYTVFRTTFQQEIVADSHCVRQASQVVYSQIALSFFPMREAAALKFQLLLQAVPASSLFRGGFRGFCCRLALCHNSYSVVLSAATQRFGRRNWVLFAILPAIKMLSPFPHTRIMHADSNSTLFHKSEFAHKLPQSIFSVKSFFAAERDKFTQQTHKNEYLHSNYTYFTINSFQKHQYVLVCSATISNFLRFSQVSFSRFHAKN